MSEQSSARSVRIGGASGFWGDSSMGAPQLVRGGKIDYLVFDYLAELTMSIMAAQKLKNPDAGFALDFVAITMRSILKEVLAKNIKVISNAGGMNPRACAKALEAVAAEQGVSVRVAVVEGDDLMPQLASLQAQGKLQVFPGQGDFPAKLLTANAYLGAAPIKAALDAGAQIVITGRCVDSAVTLGALMHAFQWSFTDWNQLAQGSLAGHIIECGCQATGGLFTDWHKVPDWANMGYPVVECFADGRFIVDKPPQTGGLITPAVVTEQMLYEIGDPANYLLPDVTCDFTQVQMRQIGSNLVEVQGAKGIAPTSSYKVSATYLDGYKASMNMALIGFDAAAKARRTGEALIERTRAMFKHLGWADYTATSVQVVGSEWIYGPHSQAQAVREAVLRLTVRHADKKALELFSREIAAPGTSFGPGTTGMEGGRPGVSPLVKQYGLLVDKRALDICWTERLQSEPISHSVSSALEFNDSLSPGKDADASLIAMPQGELKEVPLLTIAHGRSGDKGDISNIGLAARRPEFLPWILAQVTPAAVQKYLGHLVQGPVSRFYLPGVHAINLVCERALDGGGMSSMRYDALGKGMAQILLSMTVHVPKNFDTDLET